MRKLAEGLCGAGTSEAPFLAACRVRGSCRLGALVCPVSWNPDHLASAGGFRALSPATFLFLHAGSSLPVLFAFHAMLDAFDGCCVFPLFKGRSLTLLWLVDSAHLLRKGDGSDFRVFLSGSVWPRFQRAALNFEG